MTERKPLFMQSRLHIPDTRALSLLGLTCVFTLNTLQEIKRENELVTLLFAKGQPVQEDRNR